MKKRVLSLLLALALVLSMAPVAALAVESGDEPEIVDGETSTDDPESSNVDDEEESGGVETTGEAKIGDVGYDTLAKAIEEANEGDTIVLLKDLTDVAVTINKSLTLDLNNHTISGVKHPEPEEGEGGSASTKPQPVSRMEPAIVIGNRSSGGDPTLVVTIQNGSITTGTGILAYEELKTFTVTNVTFEDNCATNSPQTEGGAAVNWKSAVGETSEGTSAVFTDCKFTNNRTSYLSGGSPQGGAVCLDGVAGVMFDNCNFTGNISNGMHYPDDGTDPSANGVGGAFYGAYCGSIEFAKCTFSDNVAYSGSGGGAIHTQHSVISLNDCGFTDNKMVGGAGGAVALTYSDGKYSTIDNCTFTGNTADSSIGGAIWITEANATLTDNTITENTASAGGAIMVQGQTATPCVVSITGDLTKNKTSSSYGGAMWLYGNSNVTITGDLTENTAVTDGGAVYSKWGYYYDAGVQKVASPVVTINGDITGNKADRNGGAVYSNIGNLTVTGAITGNTAGGTGGGVYSYNGAPDSFKSTVDLTKAVIHNNEATTAADDVYHSGGKLQLAAVGKGLTLDDCNHSITGWYTDAGDKRWDCDATTEEVDAATVVGSEPCALIAAHGTRYVPPAPDPGGDDPADPDDTGVSDLLETEDHIQYLYGYPDRSFGPELNMTRAEAAQMFFNLMRKHEVEPTVHFDDVAENGWYTDAVNTLASLGIISGVGDNKFEPDRSITRAEFTAMAMKFTVGALDGENIFSDVSEGDWFYEAVVGSIQYGWIHGYEDGTFRPYKLITRAEVSSIVNKMLDRSADEAFITEHVDELNSFTDVDADHWAYEHIVEATNEHDYTKSDTGETWTSSSYQLR